METAFRMLRANSLIWHYVVHKYLYGETPPPLDVLFWNTDSTRMPAAMHGYYLRELYINNRLVETDALTIAGQPIDLNRITQPLYAVSAEDDHIAPWRSTFRVANFVSAPGALRAFEFGPHPGHHQSAGEAAQARVLGRACAPRRRSWLVEGIGGAGAGKLVAGLDGVAQAAVRADGRAAFARERSVRGVGRRTWTLCVGAVRSRCKMTLQRPDLGEYEGRYPLILQRSSKALTWLRSPAFAEVIGSDLGGVAGRRAVTLRRVVQEPQAAL